MNWFSKKQDDVNDLLRTAEAAIVRLEGDYESAKRAHRRSSAVLRNVVEYLADGLLVCELDGEIVLANSRANATLGYESLEGMNINKIVSGEYREINQRLVSDYAEHPVDRLEGTRSYALLLVDSNDQFVHASANVSSCPYNGHSLIIYTLRFTD
jgi:PAS domain S-box-containing protein